MKKVVFLKNVAVLTATSIILRLGGVVMKVWLSKTVGSEAIGLYQLIFSFYVLASTFASSGISIAVTRLTADELCIGTQNGIKKIMNYAFLITAAVAALFNAAVFFGAEKIAAFVIHDIRAAPSLKILSFSLMFMGISSCIKGYFIARRKTLPPSFSQIIEQTIRIASVMFLVKHFLPFGTTYTCYAVFLSDLIAETASCLYLFFVYRRDKFYISRLCGRKNPDYNIPSRILSISAPLTAGRYTNSILRTLEATLVPAGLISYGMQKSAALSAFGRIKGMAMPLLFFPSTLLCAFATLLIPEICEARSLCKKSTISCMIERILSFTAIIGILFGWIFFTAGDKIGKLIYSDSEVGALLTRLAPIVPLMYVDSICDGLLKGLDKQKAVFFISVSDSAMRIVLILLTLKTSGINGFIYIMYISNIYTCFANLITLIRCTELKLHIFSKILLPTLCAGGITLTANRILRLLPLPNILFTFAFLTICTIAYLALLIVTKSVSLSELRETLH